MQPFAVRRVCIALDSATSQVGPRRPVVLVVTDDADLRAAIARALDAEGYDVEAAAHGGHAVLACATRQRIDVLAVELSMADTSGPALTERLRRHHAGLRAIYLAQPGTPACDGVLVRPFTRDDLIRELLAALDPARV